MEPTNVMLMACEIQGSKGVVRIERADNINKVRPGHVFVRYNNFDPDVIPPCEDQLVAGQKISLRIGYESPDEPDAVGVLINMLRS